MLQTETHGPEKDFHLHLVNLSNQVKGGRAERVFASSFLSKYNTASSFYFVAELHHLSWILRGTSV